MRYLFLIFAVAVLGVIGLAGFRGSMSRKPPLYVFPDMDRQLKLRPQEPNSFFDNGVSSQLPPPGTIARGKPIQTAAGPVHPYADSPAHTGRIAGTTNFIDTNPLALTGPLLRRGQRQFTIHCSPCHSQVGDGNGITKKIGAMAVVANLHDKRLVEMTDGELFHVITHGRNLMGAYGPNVVEEDRWAIIAYVRALQTSRLGTINDVPPELRANLTK